MNKQLTEDHVGKLVKYVNFVHTKIPSNKSTTISSYSS